MTPRHQSPTVDTCVSVAEAPLADVVAFVRQHSF